MRFFVEYRATNSEAKQNGKKKTVRPQEGRVGGFKVGWDERLGKKDGSFYLKKIFSLYRIVCAG